MARPKRIQFEHGGTSMKGGIWEKVQMTGGFCLAFLKNGANVWLKAMISEKIVIFASLKLHQHGYFAVTASSDWSYMRPLDMSM